MLESLLRNLDEKHDEWPMNLITEINVFGSFARGALEPHDVDLDIEHELDDEWIMAEIHSFSYGRSSITHFRRPLLQGRRGCELFLNKKREWTEGFNYVTLWRRDDSLEDALARLHAIPIDPEARRAPRDAMLPQFEGLDHWLPLWLRERFVNAINDGAITLERIRLDDAVPTSPEAIHHIDGRWNPNSPLRRAANAVTGHFESRGINPETIHLHGSDIKEAKTPYFAGFNLRYVTSVDRCLGELEGLEWIEVVHPTRTRPLECLRITPVDRAKLRLSRFGP